MENNIKVGVGVYIFREGKFLVGERLNSHGAHSYACPGGHLEFGESWKEAAAREVLEETGLVVTNFKFLGVTNDYFKKENKHYITISIAADYIDGEPKILESNKCNGWTWVDLDTLPKERFIALDNLLNSEFRKNLEKELLLSKQK